MRVRNVSGTASRYELEDKINEEIEFLEELDYDVHIVAMTINDIPDVSVVVSYSIWFEVS